jgi:hypothetical protein
MAHGAPILDTALSPGRGQPVTPAPSCGIPVALACVRGNSACALPQNCSRETESGRYSSPLNYSMAYFVSLTGSHDSPGIELPRKHARATKSGRRPSPSSHSTPYSVSLAYPCGSRHPSAHTHARRMMQNQNRNHQLACGLAIIPTCVPLAQLDRASASGAEGRGFESHRGHHFSTMQSTKRAIP